MHAKLFLTDCVLLLSPLGQVYILILYNLDKYIGMFNSGVGVDPHTALALSPDSKLAKEEDLLFPASDEMTIRIGRAGPLSGKPPFIYPHHYQQPPPSTSQTTYGRDSTEKPFKTMSLISLMACSWIFLSLSRSLSLTLFFLSFLILPINICTGFLWRLNHLIGVLCLMFFCWFYLFIYFET
ncbi:unnamed protein product [Oncorhynchus mykiss]|uniref:Uncharacterized protein n=1 Tax=Oncorhynchus mykiss TaxID=8022 RepID=A0A060X8M9_ONCMY|nr:unnamed protein product [Oncorhynchus mykiss]